MPWRQVLTGLGVTFALALLMLKVPQSQDAFNLINRAVNAPAEYTYRYRIWLIAGIVIIALLILMRIVRAIVERRRRRQVG